MDKDDQTPHPSVLPEPERPPRLEWRLYVQLLYHLKDEELPTIFTPYDPTDGSGHVIDPSLCVDCHKLFRDVISDFRTARYHSSFRGSSLKSSLVRPARECVFRSLQESGSLALYVPSSPAKPLDRLPRI